MIIIIINKIISFYFTVPEPLVTLQVRDTTDAAILVGEYVTLTCEIQSSEVLIVDVNITVIVKWYRDGSMLSDSTRIRITTTTAGSSEVQSRLSFRPVASSDSGRYRCTAILTPLQGTSSSVSSFQDIQLTVQGMLVVCIDAHTINTVQYSNDCNVVTMHGTVPRLVVQTSLSPLRVLDVCPYNQFTVTCTARAELNGETIHFDITIEWQRNLVLLSSSDQIYMTTGSPESGYQSILSTTETDTQNRVIYQCIAQLTVDNQIHGQDNAYLQVQGVYSYTY